MVNRVILIGNLTKDAESLPSSGKPMTRMRLATTASGATPRGTGRRRPSTTRSSLRPARRGLRAVLHPGTRVYVEGKLRTRDFTGSDGLRRFSTEVAAESVKLLTARRPSEDLATEEPEESSRVELPVAS